MTLHPFILNECLSRADWDDGNFEKNMTAHAYLMSYYWSKRCLFFAQPLLEIKTFKYSSYSACNRVLKHERQDVFLSCEGRISEEGGRDRQDFKMRKFLRSLACLVLLCCVCLTESRVLKFVVAVSLSPIIRDNYIWKWHRDFTWNCPATVEETEHHLEATSHHTRVTLLYVAADYAAFFCSLSIIVFAHLCHSGLLWA